MFSLDFLFLLFLSFLLDFSRLPRRGRVWIFLFLSFGFWIFILFFISFRKWRGGEHKTRRQHGGGPVAAAEMAAAAADGSPPPSGLPFSFLFLSWRRLGLE